MLNFAIYREPVAQCASGSFYLIESDTVLQGLQPGGFAVAPFSDDCGWALHTIHGARRALTLAETREWLKTHMTDISQHLAPATVDADLTHAEHAALVTGFVRHLNALHACGTDGKVVAARCKTVFGDYDIINILEKLSISYPNATVFCFATEYSGLWIGATPELLLERTADRTYRAMSLAGTRPAGTAEEWDAKNSEEQQIVVDYIASNFRAAGIQPTPGERHTHRAGAIEHLCTVIEGSVSADDATTDLTVDGKGARDERAFIEALLQTFSPTPALGGYPKDMALEMIARHERTPRGAYGGYFGYVDSDMSFRLYVNLRSARLLTGAMRLYAGGGITRLSDPAAEWLETERKMKTMELGMNS